jgi:hypothetical protein
MLLTGLSNYANRPMPVRPRLMQELRQDFYMKKRVLIKR